MSNSNIVKASGNSVVSQQKPKFSAIMKTTAVKDLINNTLRDPKTANKFIADITSAVSNNPQLQECEPYSVLSSGLQAAALNLSVIPAFGEFYLVPFKTKAKFDKAGNMLAPETMKAQSQIGKNGLVQLALRSGMYKNLGVNDIKKGEYIGRNSTTGEPMFKFIEDEDVREALETVGYMAFLEYTNGFTKTIYWSKEKILNHADRYSQAFSASVYKAMQAGEIPTKDMWKYSSPWYTSFDGMAEKTMLKQLITKWGVKSVDMLSAMTIDNSVATVQDNEIVTIEQEATEESSFATTTENEIVAEVIPESETIDLNSL